MIQDRKSVTSFDTSLEFPLWCLQKCAASKDAIVKAGVRRDQIIPATDVQLPEGVDPDDVILIDQSVARENLGVGVGTMGVKS